VNVGKSGRVAQFTQGRSRAEQGSATTGVLNYGVSNGQNPFGGAIFTNLNNIYSEIDNRVSRRPVLLLLLHCAHCWPCKAASLCLLPA
jgi:hypothetical protein